MKTCRDIETLLPLYSEDALTNAEKRDVEEHLKACGHCRRELAYLQKAEQLVSEMPDVSEPPWFQQNIMAQVRKEAEKKRFVQKWFYPLRIKIPVQIMATIVIAVLAVYIYRSGENSMKQILPGVQKPAVEMQNDRALPEAPKRPEQSAEPAAPGPDASLSQNVVRNKGTSKDEPRGEAFKSSTETGSKTQPVSEVAAGKAEVANEKKTEQSVAAERYSEEPISAKADKVPSPSIPSRERKSAKEELSDQEKRAGDRMHFSMEKKMKKSTDGSESGAPATPRPMDASLGGTLQVSVSLHVNDIDAAAMLVEKTIAGFDAQISSRQRLAGRMILHFTLPEKHGPVVLSKLKNIGQVIEKQHIFENKDRRVLILLEIIQF